VVATRIKGIILPYSVVAPQLKKKVMWRRFFEARSSEGI